MKRVLPECHFPSYNISWMSMFYFYFFFLFSCHSCLSISYLMSFLSFILSVRYSGVLFNSFFYCQTEIIHLHFNLNRINFVEHFILCDLFFSNPKKTDSQNYEIKTTTHAMKIKQVYSFQIQTITIYKNGRFFFAHFR